MAQQNKTLLEKFLENRQHAGSISQETLEEYQVAIAWAQGKIKSMDAATVLKVHPNTMAQRAGAALRNLIRDGYVKLEWREQVNSREEEVS